MGPKEMFADFPDAIIQLATLNIYRMILGHTAWISDWDPHWSWMIIKRGDKDD
jgi:hypothetical protein